MNHGLKIIVPVEITDAKLDATDVPETTPASWASGTTYALGDRVRHDHKIWESIQAGNAGNSPSSSPTHWTRVSATNQWAIFDLEQVTSTAQANSMYYTLHPGENVNAVRTMGLHHVDSVRVRLYAQTSGSTPLFDTGQSAAGLLPTTADWWAYCYGPWQTVDQVGWSIDNVSVDPKIRVDYTGASTMSVGVLIVGAEHRFATDRHEGVLRGVRVRNDRRVNFAANEFDIPTMTKKAVIRTVSFTLIVRSDGVDDLMDFYRDFGDRVCFFSVSDQWRVTQVLGVLTNFELLIQGPTYSEFAIEIRGVPQQ